MAIALLPFYRMRRLKNGVLCDSAKYHVLQLWPKMLSINQIAVFFGHQYLWKESTDTTDFFAWERSLKEGRI